MKYVDFVIHDDEWNTTSSVLYFKTNLCNYANGPNQYSNTINDNNDSNIDNLLTRKYVQYLDWKKNGGP